MNALKRLSQNERVMKHMGKHFGESIKTVTKYVNFLLHVS